MKKTCTAIALMLGAGGGWAQMTPIGTWQSVDDKTGEARAQMQISEADGLLSGRIDKLLRKEAKPDARCTECSDERKDKPMLGLEIIRGAKKADGKSVWEDGQILDPENGKTYTLRLTPVEGGNRLEVRGSVLGIGRTQTWTRVQ